MIDNTRLDNGNQNTITGPSFIVKNSIVRDNVWVAANAFVHPAINIGNGCVVGVRSVVISEVPERMVCSENPCKPIKPGVTIY